MLNRLGWFFFLFFGCFFLLLSGKGTIEESGKEKERELIPYLQLY